jgi:hypothetical protein
MSGPRPRHAEGTLSRVCVSSSDASSYLEYLPDPQIPFPGSRCGATMKVTLVGDGVAVVSDSFLQHDPAGREFLRLLQRDRRQHRRRRGAGDRPSQRPTAAHSKASALACPAPSRPKAPWFLLAESADRQDRRGAPDHQP